MINFPGRLGLFAAHRIVQPGGEFLPGIFKFHLAVFQKYGIIS